MQRTVRYGIIAFLVAYAFVTAGGALIQSGSNSACLLLAASDLVYIAALAYPLLSFDEKKDGWLHPLVFATLYFGILRGLTRTFGIFIFGLSEHAALPLGPDELTRLVAYENVLNALALVSTYFGYFLARKYRPPTLSAAPPRALDGMVVFSAIASIVALTLYVRLSGSFFQHIRNLGLNATAKEFSEDVAGVGLYITTAQWFALFLCIAFVYRYNPLADKLQKARFWVTWLPLFIVANGIGYLALGKRSGMIITLGMFFSILMIKERRLPWLRLAAGLAVVVVVFAAIQVSRNSAGTAKTFEDLKAAVEQGTGDSAASTMEELVARRGSYASVYPILHYVPDQSPLLLGETYLTIFTRPIPRAWWPNKPRGTDFRAGATFFGSVWGIPPGGVGEAYWNFHIPGVILVYGLFGCALRCLANLFVANTRHGLVVVFYTYCLLNFQPAENALTGCLQNLIPFAIFGFGANVLRKAPLRRLATPGVSPR